MQRLLFTVRKALGIIFGLEKYLQMDILEQFIFKMESTPRIKPENNFRIKFIESPRQGKIY